MRSILLAVLAFIALSLPARADWPLDKMNRQIEQTNVIFSGICSGTIIDVKRRLVLTAYHCVTDNLREVEKKEVDPKTGEIIGTLTGGVRGADISLAVPISFAKAMIRKAGFGAIFDHK